MIGVALEHSRLGETVVFFFSGRAIGILNKKNMIAVGFLNLLERFIFRKRFLNILLLGRYLNSPYIIRREPVI